jgi:hypothetical protein
MAPGELEGRPASRRERDHDGTIDPYMVEQQRVGIRLIGRRRPLRERRSEVPEARRSDDPEPGAGKVGKPAVDGVDVASEHAVGHEQRHPLALVGIFDRPEARLEPLRRERVDALPGTAHVLAVAGHSPYSSIDPSHGPTTL